MRCKNARRAAALYAGGDLAGEQVSAFEAHVRDCVDCAAALAEVRRAREQIGRMAAADTPEPLPENFARRIQRHLEREAGHGITAPHAQGRFRQSALIIVPVALAASLVLLITGVFREDGDSIRPVVSAPETPGEIVRAAGPSVTWSEFQGLHGGAVQGPFAVDDWQPTGEAAVYLVMHKPDPIGAPDTYRIDYCGESGRLLSFKGNPWVQQRSRRLLRRAGSRANVYVAVITAPNFTKRDRLRVVRTVIETYEPFFNRRIGV